METTHIFHSWREYLLQCFLLPLSTSKRNMFWIWNKIILQMKRKYSAIYNVWINFFETFKSEKLSISLGKTKEIWYGKKYSCAFFWGILESQNLNIKIYIYFCIFSSTSFTFSSGNFYFYLRKENGSAFISQLF